MGSAASIFWWRKKKPPVYAKERREPLTNAQEILNSPEGKERLQFAMDQNLPGTVFRWDKIVKLLGTDLAPTYEQNDPIRIEIDLTELKKMLKLVYEGNWQK